jgi:hypothetical protein
MTASDLPTHFVGLSHRLLLLDADDRIHRIAVNKFHRMLTNPTMARCPRFAGQRIRMAGVHVRLIDRKPIEVARTSFHILSFDRTGLFDAQAYLRQEFSRAEVAVAPVLNVLSTDANDRSQVVEATARFAARGGSWVPTRALERVIEDAALGRLRCKRL